MGLFFGKIIFTLIKCFGDLTIEESISFIIKNVSITELSMHKNIKASNSY